MGAPDNSIMRCSVDIVSYDGTGKIKVAGGQRFLAEECPVNVTYGGIPYAVMMTSPTDLADFAYGFSLTEGVINVADQILNVRLTLSGQGAVLDIDLAPDALHRHMARGRSRAMNGRTGCGICGIEDLSQLPQADPPAQTHIAVSLSAVRKALDCLTDLQPLNNLTHSVHAAAIADSEGRICTVREDVGRHNALDKLLGAILQAPESVPEDIRTSGFVLLTSRCSYEMIEKAACFGMKTIVAISAPTQLALDRARKYGMTLIAIARSDGAVIFNDASIKQVDAA